MSNLSSAGKPAEPGFGFLKIPEARKKPRDRRWTIMSDRSIPVSHQLPLMEMIGGIVDRVKLVDHVGLMYRLPAELLSRKLGIYRDFGVPTFPGGVPFEIAYQQGHAEEFFNQVKKLGFTGVEVSSDCIPEIPKKERIELIGKARSIGLEVFTEVGYKVVGDKFGQSGLTAEVAIDMISEDIKAGASKVAIENNELLSYIKAKDTTTLRTIVDAVGIQSCLFEVGGGGVSHPEIAKWLFQEFGADVNVENVEVDRVIHIEAMRHGLSRAVDFCYFDNGIPK